MKLHKFSFVFILAGFLFIGCNKKSTKPSIVGKWVFKEMIYMPGNKLFDEMEEADKKTQKEEADREMKGTRLEFTEDGHYTISPPDRLNEESLHGTYKMSGQDKLLLKRGDREEQTTIISFPGKNLLRMEDQKNHIVMIVEKQQ